MEPPRRALEQVSEVEWLALVCSGVQPLASSAWRLSVCGLLHVAAAPFSAEESQAKCCGMGGFDARPVACRAYR